MAAAAGGAATPTPTPDADGLVGVYVTVPPDGGWGWVVLAAAFYIQILFGATMLVVSSLVEGVANEFKVTLGEASTFTALFGGCAYCIGPVVAMVAHKFGFRWATSTGTLLGVAGFVGGACAPSLPLLVFTYGFLGGIGFGMIFVPSIVVVNFYFERWRALVQGITVCGTSVGGSVAPPLFLMAVNNLGWRNMVLIEAGMLLSCGLASLLYVPLTPVLQRVTPAELAMHSKPHSGIVECIGSLFRTPSYLLFGMTGICAMTCLMIPFVYWPARSRALGVDAATTDWLVSACNLSSLFGRLACGLIASYPRLPLALPIFNVTIVAAGAALCLSFLTVNAVFQIVVAVLYGLHQASFNALRSVILVELVGLQQLTHAIGFLLLTQGVAIIAGPPLAGELKEATDNYDAVFWFAGGLLLTGSLFCLPLSCVKRWEEARAARSRTSAAQASS